MRQGYCSNTTTLVGLVAISTIVATGDAWAADKASSRIQLHEVLAESRWIDLTYTFDNDTVYWPTASGFELHRGPAGYTEKGYYYCANRFAAAEHGGTHIDAPVHFFEGGDTVDQIPLENLVGTGAVVDLSAKCSSNADYQIVVADLLAWEQEHGQTLRNSLVRLRTGWGSFWPDRERYLGTAERGSEAVAKLHFPGLHPDAARWLIEQRAIRAVGIDTASIDYGQSVGFQSHVTLFEHGVPVFENVAMLDSLPEVGFLLVALPMKIGTGSGGPLRIVAAVGKDSQPPEQE